MRFLAILILVLSAAAPLGAQTIIATSSPRYSVTITTITPIEVTVTGGPGNIRDYVGLYTLGQKEFLTWLYVNGTQSRPAKGSAGGRVTFPPQKPGQYEVKFWGLTDAGIATLIKGTQVSVVLTPIEIDGVELAVTRKPDSTTDELTLSIQGGKGTLSASASTPVTTDGKIINPGP